MAEITGFRGIRYDVDKAGAALTDLVAPPYDVISSQEQTELYGRNPYNVVRLILGREQDKYESAGRLFRQWRAEGILTADEQDAVYVYRQSFIDPNTQTPCPERIGLVCLLKLEEYSSGGVLPHENTLTAAKADRLDLLRATQAQFESIYGLYSDPDRAVQSFLGEYDDREMVLETVPAAIGSSHTVERIRDEDAIGALQTLMRDKKIFIADGHHRYETALNYRREVRAARSVPDDQAIPEDYILITLTAFEDEGLLVLPTHRLIHGIDAEKLAGLPQALEDQFMVEALAPDDDNERVGAALETRIAEKAVNGQIAFGLVLPNESPRVLVLKVSPDPTTAESSGVQSEAVKRLPVTLLHSLILDNVLGIGEDALAAGETIAYTRSAAEAVTRVQNGECQAAFFLGRPGVEEVRDVSLAGDKMPQKSTFFFPKLLSGLLLRAFELVS